MIGDGLPRIIAWRLQPTRAPSLSREKELLPGDARAPDRVEVRAERVAPGEVELVVFGEAAHEEPADGGAVAELREDRRRERGGAPPRPRGSRAMTPGESSMGASAPSKGAGSGVGSRDRLRLLGGLLDPGSGSTTRRAARVRLDARRRASAAAARIPRTR